MQNLIVSCIRTLRRTLLIVATLAYALALGQLAHARMLGTHAASGHDHARLAVICAEHGLQLPAKDGSDRKPSHQCPDCISCAAVAFKAVAATQALEADWPLRFAGIVIHPARLDPAHGSRAPPDITARGPPVLI